MRNGIRLMTGMVVLVLGLALAACESDGTSRGATTQGAGLIPAPASPIADVPLPAGFKVEGSPRSDLIPRTSLRFVVYQFRGSDDFLPVVRFYRDQTPKFGWTMVSQHQVGDQMTLNFTKGTEELVITVTEGTFNTHVDVRLYPSR